MATLTITSAKKNSLNSKTFEIVKKIDNKNFIISLDNVEYRVATYHLDYTGENGEKIITCIEGTGSYKMLNMWIEKNGKKTKRTMVYKYIVN